MGDWEKFSEVSLPKKEHFYSHLYMEDITDADYAHAKKNCKDFKIKYLGEYHNFYVQSDTLLLTDLFGNFRNMCLEIYELDPAKFLPASYRQYWGENNLYGWAMPQKPPVNNFGLLKDTSQFNEDFIKN